MSASPFSILTALTSFMSVTGGETQYQLKEAVACHVSNKYSADALQRAFAQVFCIPSESLGLGEDDFVIYGSCVQGRDQ